MQHIPDVSRTNAGRGELTAQQVDPSNVSRETLEGIYIYGGVTMLSWSEKLSLLTTKGLTWKEVQELDKGLDEEKQTPPEDKSEDEEKQTPPEDKPEDKSEDKLEPTETEKKLQERIESLEAQLKEAQADNVHGNNEGSQEPSFDEQLETMFEDFRI